MDLRDSDKTKLEGIAKGIDGIYKDSLVEIKHLGDRAVVLFKDILKKREQKKIEDLTKKLKE